MRKVLALVALAEAATGLLLLAWPAMAVRALFGAEIVGAGTLMCRVAAIALIGLGVACWPGSSGQQPRYGMMVYGALITLYLVYVGIRGEGAGIILWPAVAVHAVMLVLLAFAPLEHVSEGAGRVES